MNKNLCVCLKLALSILFFLCLFNFPYGFYSFVRYAAFIGFVILAYQYNENVTMMTIYIALAVLFQPFYKIYLGRVGWNIVDVIVALGLIGSIFLNKDKNSN